MTGRPMVLPHGAAVCVAMTRSVIVRWFREQRIDPPGLEVLLDEIDRWVAEPRHAASSEVGTVVAVAGSEVECCVWLSVRESADQLGISTRAVRKAIQEGRLAGQRKGRGRGVWEVSETSVESYRVRKVA